MSDQPPLGRPSSFTQETADLICERIAAGESLRAITLDEDMPGKATVFRWLRSNVSFRDQYARAKEFQAESFAEELMDIADDGTNDWMQVFSKQDPGKAVGWIENGEALRRSALRVETRKWVMSRLLAKKYGDKLDVNHGGEVVTKIIVNI